MVHYLISIGPNVGFIQIFILQLFDTIKEQQPGLIEEKLLPIIGDMTELRLGLSDEDFDYLVNNVSIIFHVAASVRFNESIKDATIMNVRGTREVVELAKLMKNLTVSGLGILNIVLRYSLIIVFR